MILKQNQKNSGQRKTVLIENDVQSVEHSIDLS